MTLRATIVIMMSEVEFQNNIMWIFLKTKKTVTILKYTYTLFKCIYAKYIRVKLKVVDTVSVTICRLLSLAF